MKLLTKEEFQSICEGMTANDMINIMPKNIQHYGGMEFELIEVFGFAYTAWYRSETPCDLVEFKGEGSDKNMLLRLFEHNYLSEYKIKR